MTFLRRLAKDHAALQHALPPNYVFPHSSDPILSDLPDELTSLHIYLVGPASTPYTAGLFLLHLKIPSTFPTSPPTATFRTKIFHPNVDEKTGVVCLETLKRDWDPKLTLKDILVHISCLLVQPNPDSALNENAGVLVREDYEGFERKASLLTKIHAYIPSNYTEDVDRARRRGEDDGVLLSQQDSKASKQENGRVLTVKGNDVEAKHGAQPTVKEHSKSAISARSADESVKPTVLGKRAVSLEAEPVLVGDAAIPANATLRRHEETGEPFRKSPKHEHGGEFESTLHSGEKDGMDALENRTENKENSQARVGVLEVKETSSASTLTDALRPGVLRKISNLAPPGKLRAQARIGIRRL